MDCDYIKKMIPIFLDGELHPEERDQVQEHILYCADCKTEFDEYIKTWNVLNDVEDIEPEPAYMSRFWTEFAARTPWYQKIALSFQGYFFKRKTLAGIASLCAVVIVSFLVFLNYFHITQTERILANTSQEEIELLENFEIVQDMDIIENLEDLDLMET